MSSLNVHNEALVFVGPGFSEQNAMIRNLESLNLRVRTSFLPTANDSAELAKIARGAQLIILRAPYWISPEELLYVDVMGQRLKHFFEEFKHLGGLQPEQKLLGIGRGAFLLLRSQMFGEPEMENVEFSKNFTVDHPWIGVEQKELNLKLNAFVFSPQVPEWNTDTLKKWQPWLWSQNTPMGWKSNQGGDVFASFIDILAFSTRKQMLDYGYEDLSHLPTQTDVLQRLIQGAI